MTPQEQADAILASLYAAEGDRSFQAAFCYALGVAQQRAVQGDPSALLLLQAAVERTARVEAVAS